MPGTEYVWNEPNRSISVHLPLDVVSRLGLDAMEAYKAVPKRGLEIGGLLLGRTDGTVIHISDFQPVESEHRWGPSYRLSDTDLAAFDAALRQHADAVGIYRTSTLPNALTLEEDDVKLFRNHFPDPGKVYLLVQPKRGNAVFFVTDGETLAPGHEFPFRASELPSEMPEAEPIAVPAVVMAAKPALPLPKPKRNRTRWVQAGALVFGMVMGAAAYQAFRSAPHPAPAVSAPRPVAAAPDPKPSPTPSAHVPLSVQWAGTSVMLYWNPDTPAIQHADKGILYISDGNRQKGLMLDHGDLASGVISYRPQSGDVTFRLKIFNGNQSTDESIRVVGNAIQPVRPSRPAEKPAASAASSEEQASDQGTASRAEPVAEPVEPRPSPFTPVPKSMVAATAAAPSAATAAGNAAAPPSPTRTPAPEVLVRVEPAGGSRLSHAVGHIPLLRRLNKSQSFVPPVPTHEVHPVLTVRTRNTLTDNVPIDIKVRVGKTGKVEDVEMLGHAERQPLFAELALSAARRWEFTPARMGQDKVPGEVILHFTFLMPPPPAQQ